MKQVNNYARRIERTFKREGKSLVGTLGDGSTVFFQDFVPAHIPVVDLPMWAFFRLPDACRLDTFRGRLIGESGDAYAKRLGNPVHGGAR